MKREAGIPLQFFRKFVHLLCLCRNPSEIGDSSWLWSIRGVVISYYSVVKHVRKKRSEHNCSWKSRIIFLLHNLRCTRHPSSHTWARGGIFLTYCIVIFKWAWQLCIAAMPLILLAPRSQISLLSIEVSNISLEQLVPEKIGDNFQILRLKLGPWN